MAVITSPNGYIFYHYIPTQPGAIVVAALFALGTLAVLWRSITTRTMFAIPFMVGGVRTISKADSYDPSLTMLPYRLFLCSLLLGLSTVQATPCKAKATISPDPIFYPQGSNVESSQKLNSSAFIGAPAKKKTMLPRFKYNPELSLMHTNGNAGSSDDPGPLGINLNISSSTNTINMMLWGPDGSLICGYANASAAGLPRGLLALDPTTFDILAVWYPPASGAIGFAYMEYIEKTNDVLLSTKEGHVYVVHRSSCQGVPYFNTIRIINLSNVLEPDERLLNTMYDTAENIWFSSGGILGTGDTTQNSTTYGYITPERKVVKSHVENEFVENGIAISGMDMYMVIGPAGTADKPNATGYMYSMTSDGHGGIQIHWRVPYDAGSGKATDAISVPSRGAGSTPALLTDQYVAITDKSDSQIHLNIYHQEAVNNSKEDQLLCQVPLFTPSKSNNDNAVITHFDGTTHGVKIQNDFDSPSLYMPQSGAATDVNGDWNDVSIMAGGMVRVDIDTQDQCSLRWTSDLAVKAVSILSTKMGLLYNYIQDTERASSGEYIWYVAGVDWATGETVFQVRTGEGGTINDNWSQGTVGPDGTPYQSILGGVVAVKDGQ